MLGRKMRGVLSFLLLGLSLVSGFCEEFKTKVFRVMTYNIHHGQGPDGQFDLERIAELIKLEKADIVALQEVDRGTLRTARRDLPAELARLTGMNFVFEKNIDYQGGEYGNAILTRFPILEVTNLHYSMTQAQEQRGLLQALLGVEGRKLLFMSTHLDYRSAAERLRNVAQIREVREAAPDRPVIVCGDFNDGPGSQIHKRLSEFLTDVWNIAGNGNGFTFSSTRPLSRIDYIWISKGVVAVKAWIPQSKASDHLSIVAEFALE